MPPLHQTAPFKVTVFILASIFIGALLTPPFYWIGQSLIRSGFFEGKPILGLDLHDELIRAELPRYFNRAMLAGALICIWPTIRWLGARPSQFLKLDPNPRRFAHLGFGFALGAVSLLALGWILVQTGVFRSYDEADPVAEILFTAAVSAFAVGFLEEFFFRGCLLGLALLTARRLAALAFVSVLFSAVHFLKPPQGLDLPDPVTWSSGFWLVGQIFAQFGNPAFILAEFITLLAVGWILGYARLKTKSLWLPIGLHAGWVFGIKVFSALTRRAMDLDETLPWIGKDLKSGLVALVMVSLTGLIVWLTLKFQPRTSGRQ